MTTPTAKTNTKKTTVNTMIEKLYSMAAEARIAGHFIEVSEIRYTVCGIPTEITEDYIYFDEAYEIESTGKLGSVPKAEKCFGGKIVAMQAITMAGFIKKPAAE